MPADKGFRVGIEAKIAYHPLLDVLGDKYESMRRTGLNDMQFGMSENEIEKSYQSRFNIQWAWEDSLATEVKQTYKQLTTAKKLNIIELTKYKIAQTLIVMLAAILTRSKKVTRHKAATSLPMVFKITN